MAKVKDPVCKMEIGDSSEFFITHEGKKYYFCSPACKATFEKSPAEILKGGGIKMPTPSKIDFNVWWQRIILTFVIALVIAVAAFIIKEKPFSEESQLRYQEEGGGHYDPPDVEPHGH